MSRPSTWRLRRIAVTALVSALALAVAPAARAADGDSGRVRFMQHAASDFDVFTRNPTPSQREWMPLNMRGNQQMRKYH